MRQPYVVPRRRIVIALWCTVLALPILLLDNIPKTNASAGQNVAAASAPTSAPTTTSTTVTTLPPTTEPPTTEYVAPTTAYVPPTTAYVPPTTAKPKAAVAAATIPPTTAPPTTAAPPAAAAPSGNSQDGMATFYDYRPGECAHLTIAKGTVVTVTNVATGASTTCIVTDRGPYGAGRIIDLDRSTFAQIASTDAGVVQVHITW